MTGLGSMVREVQASAQALQFALTLLKVHRSVIVNLKRVSHVTRGLNETADVHLEGRNETLPVSRSFLHLFRQI